MGTQRDGAGGRARVPRIADLALFSSARAAYWIAILGSNSPPVIFFVSSALLHAITRIRHPNHLNTTNFLRTVLITNGHHEHLFFCVHHLMCYILSHCSTDREHVTFLLLLPLTRTNLA
jgi:hypothetical protein